jgi:hypothetical protein
MVHACIMQAVRQRVCCLIRRPTAKGSQVNRWPAPEVYDIHIGTRAGVTLISTIGTVTQGTAAGVRRIGAGCSLVIAWVDRWDDAS